MRRAAWRSCVASTVSIVMLLGEAAPLAACASGPAEAVFTDPYHPDSPREYFSGRFGVVLPTYRIPYLWAAWRFWAGRPVSAAERDALAPAPASPSSSSSMRPPAVEGPALWAKARATLGGDGSTPDPYRLRSGGSFDSYLNCGDDAFRTAAATLAARVASDGAQSPAVRNWVAAQDVVFSVCSSGRAAPDPAPSGSPEWLGKDRAYQIAAAHFHSEMFDDAEREFRAIASDAGSSWKTIAPYLAARCIVRKATLLPGDDAAGRREGLARAERELTRLAETGGPTRLAVMRLLGFVRFRLDPAARLAELDRELSSPQPDENVQTDLTDYALLLAGSTAPPRTEMSEWISVFRDPNPAAGKIALERWREKRSLPWLVAAITKVPVADTPADLADAAGRINSGSPAFETVALAVLRRAVAAGDVGTARRVADAALARWDIPLSTRNRFLAERLRVEDTLGDFVRDTVRMPLRIGWESVGWDFQPDPGHPVQPLFDSDAANAFESLPVSLWPKAARVESLPAHLRRNVLLAAWTRAVVVENPEIAGSLAEAVAQAEPALAPDMKSYAAAQPGPARRFEALLVLLRHPGLTVRVAAGPVSDPDLVEIDSIRGNWWCPLRGPEGTAVFPLPFLTEPERAAARRESTAVQGAGNAPDYLTRRALEEAKKRPDDPRSPEALHLAVRATRFGCSSERTRALSKEAFDLLHAKYRGNPWTARTPYWFGGQ